MVSLQDQLQIRMKSEVQLLRMLVSKSHKFEEALSYLCRCLQYDAKTKRYWIDIRDFEMNNIGNKFGWLQTKIKETTNG